MKILVQLRRIAVFSKCLVRGTLYLHKGALKLGAKCYNMHLNIKSRRLAPLADGTREGGYLGVWVPTANDDDISDTTCSNSIIGNSTTPQK